MNGPVYVVVAVVVAVVVVVAGAAGSKDQHREPNKGVSKMKKGLRGHHHNGRKVNGAWRRRI